MKEPKKIELPREVWMGPGVLSRTGEICSKLRLQEKGLLVADSTTFRIAGKRVERLLKREGFEVSHQLVKETNLREVKNIRRKIREEKIGFLLGVGGGSCIDLAKLSSFQEHRPFISIPTAASHDGIASARASVKGVGKPVSVATHPPVAVIADTLIIKSAPHRFLAAGCGDLVANFTAVRDWELAHMVKHEPYSEYAAALSLMSAQIVVENAEVIRRHSEESVRKVVKSLISSGVAMGIAGSSRPASGGEHLFSHALDKIAPKPALHGEQCGVGAIMVSYMQGGDWKTIRDALEVIGCPTTAKELGIPREYIIKAFMMAPKLRPERYTILSKGLKRKVVERVARETGVV